MAPILGYWDVRGIVQPIRMLLEYTGTRYEEKLYVCGPAPSYDKSCWLNEKDSLGLDFPNLPCRTFLRVAVFTSQLPHLPQSLVWFIPYIVICYMSTDFESDKAAYLAGLPAKWKSLSDFLGSRKWLAGDNLTYPDLIAYELLYQHQALAPGCLQDFPLLQDLMRRVEGLKGIKEFLQTPKCKDMPFNNPVAHFGGRASK
ncbi:glutathione S-transferase [Hyalella azteca]|uniref:glutathione transferase n=1 Tax=Hyalella azteca TaxID=294128 RepID=A0A8B7P221_HYAAZ|nr:glutathione S-transferase [Hyalella azteca]